jgi:hypothetical protein
VFSRLSYCCFRSLSYLRFVSGAGCSTFFCGVTAVKEELVGFATRCFCFCGAVAIESEMGVPHPQLLRVRLLLLEVVAQWLSRFVTNQCWEPFILCLRPSLFHLCNTAGHLSVLSFECTLQNLESSGPFPQSIAISPSTSLITYSSLVLDHLLTHCGKLQNREQH